LSDKANWRSISHALISLSPESEENVLARLDDSTGIDSPVRLVLSPIRISDSNTVSSLSKICGRILTGVIALVGDWEKIVLSSLSSQL
jgi:hypothetical protein